MGVLGRFEQRLEEMVRGGFARVFKGQVEPVEIAAALQKEADQRKAVMGPGRTIAPNAYLVTLGPADGERLMPYAQPLGREFASMVREHCEDQGWQFFGEVRVHLQEDEELAPGVFRVHGTVSPDGEQGEQDQQGGAQRRASSGAQGGGQSSPDPATQATPSGGGRDPRDGRPRIVVTAGGDAEIGTPEADGQEAVHELTKSTTVIGRGSDTDVRLPDTGVSRKHAEIRLQGDTVEVVDLASTNGTRVNGRSIDRAPLHDGDRVELGSTTLVFRRDP